MKSQFIVTDFIDLDAIFNLRWKLLSAGTLAIATGVMCIPAGIFCTPVGVMCRPADTFSIPTGVMHRPVYMQHSQYLRVQCAPATCR